MQEEKQIDFDFNEILKEFRSGKRLTGKDGLLAPLIKQLTEVALEDSFKYKTILYYNRLNYKRKEYVCSYF